jgi:hypothetical protein
VGLPNVIRVTTLEQHSKTKAYVSIKTFTRNRPARFGGLSWRPFATTAIPSSATASSAPTPASALGRTDFHQIIGMGFVQIPA